MTPLKDLPVIKRLFKFSQKESEGFYIAEIETLPLFTEKYDRQIASRVSIDINDENFIQKSLLDLSYSSKRKEDGLNDLVNDFLNVVIREIGHGKNKNAGQIEDVQ